MYKCQIMFSGGEAIRHEWVGEEQIVFYILSVTQSMTVMAASLHENPRHWPTE